MLVLGQSSANLWHEIKVVDPENWNFDKIWNSREFNFQDLFFADSVHNHEDIYQDPSRLPTVGHHGWPSAGGNWKQVLKNYPLTFLEWWSSFLLNAFTDPQQHHHPTFLTPHTQQIRKFQPPNIQPVPYLKRLEAMPSSTIVSHNLGSGEGLCEPLPRNFLKNQTWNHFSAYLSQKMITCMVRGHVQLPTLMKNQYIDININQYLIIYYQEIA